MFERFTERARQAVVKAQEEARGLCYDYIGTEHLLLALAADPELDLSAATLLSLGVDCLELRKQITRNPGGELEPTTGQIPFKRLAKKALELSLRESLSLGHSHIGTEHVLLGLVGGPVNKATQLLLEANISPEQVRERLIEHLVSRASEGSTTGSGDGEAGTISPGLAIRTAVELNPSFQVRPDSELRHALTSAAAKALREGRDQYGIADLTAVIDSGLDQPD